MSQPMKHRDQILGAQALLREALGDLFDYWTFKYDGVMRGDDRLQEEPLQKTIQCSVVWNNLAHWAGNRPSHQAPRNPNGAI